VRGAGQTLISRRQVTYIEENFETNAVDAAVAKVEDPSDIEAFYDGINIFCPHPLEPSYGMKVQKLGNATGVTSGKVICHLDQVFVSAPKGRGGADFRDQWLIGSDDTFVSNGDSGALVIGCGHPVALLFAMADSVEGMPDDQSFIAPFGLATSICGVLKQIEAKLGMGEGDLEIMLHHKRKETCPHAHLHADEKCPPPTKKCPEGNPPTAHEREHKGHKQHNGPKA
jgi:hypothetical protein